ncbi:MAG: pitrilysin family protein, partial [Parvularcula sp.]|nr:pitrilysin family protein [Parvularcula sp.]
DPGFYQTELEELENADPKGVLAAAQKWLGDNYHQITVVPSKDFEVKSAGVDRSTGLPSVRGETELDFPEIETTTLSNGIEVVFAQRDTVPVVNVAIQFDAGFAADAGGKLGRANFTTRMLDEGAGRYDALELAGELEKLGATLSAGSSVDTTTVELSALSENLKASLGLMGDVVRRPAFDAEEIERQRALVLNGIRQEQSQPFSIALRELPQMMYGEDHAYGIPLTGSGTIEDVTEITRDDLVSFHETWMRPDNATLYVVGDTTLNEVKPLLEAEFGNWRASGEKPEKNIAEIDYVDPKVVIVNRPGSPQSLILGGHIAPPQGAENNIAISAMNEIFGGNFNARVNSNLREEKGWSYGSYTFLSGAKGQRPFIVYAPVQTDQTGPSIAELKKEFAGFLGDNPATEQELQNVVLDNVRSLPGQFETSDAVLSSLLSSGTYGRDYNYPETLPAKYRNLSVADIRAAAEEVLQPGQLVWLIVGDAAKIRDEVEAANLGPVEVIELSDL